MYSGVSLAVRYMRGLNESFSRKKRIKKKRNDIKPENTVRTTQTHVSEWAFVAGFCCEKAENWIKRKLHQIQELLPKIGQRKKNAIKKITLTFWRRGNASGVRDEYEFNDVVLKNWKFITYFVEKCEKIIKLFFMYSNFSRWFFFFSSFFTFFMKTLDNLCNGWVYVFSLAKFRPVHITLYAGILWYMWALPRIRTRWMGKRKRGRSSQ